DELTPVAGSLTVGGDAAPVEFDQPLRERETHAESRVGAIQQSTHLGERVEDPGKHVGGIPIPESRTDITTFFPSRRAVTGMRPFAAEGVAGLFSRFDKTGASRVGSASTRIGSGGMGLYLRKSFRLGPLRLNVSNYGIGLSTGVKGARFGVDAGGHSYTRLG